MTPGTTPRRSVAMGRNPSECTAGTSRMDDSGSPGVPHVCHDTHNEPTAAAHRRARGEVGIAVREEGHGAHPGRLRPRGGDVAG